MPYLLIFFPLLGSILGYLAKSLGDKYSEIITTTLVIISAIFSCIIFYNGAVHNLYDNYKILDWISSGNFKVNWSINIDPLSSIMLVVVTSVSSLVHIYSIGYMSHDPNKPRFMSYLSLFTFVFVFLLEIIYHLLSLLFPSSSGVKQTGRGEEKVGRRSKS